MATATAVDEATSAVVRDQNVALNSFTADYASRPGSTVTAMVYHGERIPHTAEPLDPRDATTRAGATSSRQ
jgi:hypothetical protein